MSLRISIILVLVLLAGLSAATVTADENQADRDTVLQRLDAIQDSLEGQNGTFESRFSDLEREIGSLRRLPSVHTVSMTQEGEAAPLEGCRCQKCSRCLCRCYPTGLEAGVEATYLKLFPGFSNVGGTSLGFDTRAAPRIWLGYKYNDRWGIRARYWDYFTQTSGRYIERDSGYSAYQMFDTSVDVYSVDVELTRRASIGNWSLLGSIGARYANFSFDVEASSQTISLITDTVSVSNGGQSTIYDGVGMTFALDGKRPIGFWDLSLMFKLRGSVLWGDDAIRHWGTSMTMGPDGAGNLILVDTNSADISGSAPKTMWIGEAQIGLEWSRPFKSYGGGDIFVRGALEVQSWSSDREDVFFGSAFAAGFNR